MYSSFVCLSLGPIGLSRYSNSVGLWLPFWKGKIVHSGLRSTLVKVLGQLHGSSLYWSLYSTCILSCKLYVDFHFGKTIGHI